MYSEESNQNIESHKKVCDELGLVLLMVDPSNGHIVAGNQTALDFYGHSINRLNGMTISDIQVEPKITEQILNAIANTSKQLKYKATNILASGEKVNVEVNANSFSDKGNSIVSYIVSKTIALSDYKEVSMMNMETFKSFFSDNTLPMVVVDFKDFNIIEANIYAEKFFGLNAKDIVNTPFYKYSVLPKVHFNSALKSFAENGYTGLEITFNTKTKGKRDTEIHYTLAKTNKKSLLLCLLVDVTERNHALTALHGIKNNLAEEVKRQTTDLVRINNSLLDQIQYRRTVEKKLLQSQEMFKRLFQLNPNGMVLKHSETKKIVEVNQSFLKTFELKAKDVIGMSLESLEIISNLKSYQKIHKQLEDKRIAQLMPLDMKTTSGLPKHILFSGEIIKEEDGDYILEFFQDITEIQIAQEKLADSEKRYRTMYNNALVGIYRAEVDTGVIVSSNLQFAKMLGYKHINDIIGKSILEHYPEISSRVKLVSELKKNSTTVQEYELRTKLDKKIWVVNYARFYPEENLLDAVVVDISDRKLMEDLLTINENRFRSMIENASDIIIIVDKNGDLLYQSPSVEKILGYSYNINKTANVLDYIDPKDKERAADFLTGKTSKFEPNEVKVRHKNGIYRIYEFTPTNLLHDPSINGIIINGRDITAQVKAREEINITLQKEQELSRQKTQFISTVSHEFRTPLTNISLNIQLLNKYINEKKSDNTGQSITRINNAVKRLTALLNEISLVSKDQSGKLQFSPEKRDIHSLIDELMDQIYYLIQSNIEIDVHKGVNHNVLADKYLLSHIVNNLLNNAIKYSPKKGKIYLSLKATPSNNLEIYIKDNGIGIPESEIDFLFDPYFRASNVKHIGGSGIGLSIVKRCVEFHKGNISVKSKLGKGTEVMCTIPLQKLDN